MQIFSVQWKHESFLHCKCFHLDCILKFKIFFCIASRSRIWFDCLLFDSEGAFFYSSSKKYIFLILWPNVRRLNRYRSICLIFTQQFIPPPTSLLTTSHCLLFHFNFRLVSFIETIYIFNHLLPGGSNFYWNVVTQIFCIPRHRIIFLKKVSHLVKKIFSIISYYATLYVQCIYLALWKDNKSHINCWLFKRRRRKPRYIITNCCRCQVHENLPREICIECLVYINKFLCRPHKAPLSPRVITSRTCISSSDCILITTIIHYFLRIIIKPFLKFQSCCEGLLRFYCVESSTIHWVLAIMCTFTQLPKRLFGQIRNFSFLNYYSNLSHFLRCHCILHSGPKVYCMLFHLSWNEMIFVIHWPESTFFFLNFTNRSKRANFAILKLMLASKPAVLNMIASIKMRINNCYWFFPVNFLQNQKYMRI